MGLIQAISFDCAETLLRVRWSPGPFAILCARELQLDIDEQMAQDVYLRLFHRGYRRYVELHQYRDDALIRQWWREVTEEWLVQIGVGSSRTDDLLAAANRLLYDPNGDLFERFPDVLPCLNELRNREIPLIVISNWDESLSRILASRGLLCYFKFALASLVEGIEKPDPQLFQIAAAKLGIPAQHILHVGDSPLDDLQGAQGAGMQARLIDRGSLSASPLALRSLAEVIPLVT